MHLVVHADQRQFSLRDKAARLSGSGWTAEAVTTHRIGAEPQAIAIATARSDLVESAVTVHTAPPAVPADAEHVVEADLDAPSGELIVSGPADYPSQERTVPLTPGRYRVRVSYVPAGPPPAEWNDFEYGDHLKYVVDLWPTSSPAGVVVVRQGSEVWDG